MGRKVHDTSSDVVLTDDESVALIGPGGVEVELTPEAAMETSDRLYDAVVHARGKKIMGQIANRKPS